jgi:pSer/pThr/pTyr-binding forkhead associated (FHA) protein
MATLLIISGSRAGKHYPLGHRTNVVGRDEGLLIQILDKHVSRKHLLLRYDKEKRRYFARDLQSRHGVFVNRNKIDDEVSLDDNDTIDIGRTTLLFTTEDSADRAGALADFRKPGERHRTTMAV